MKKYSISKPRKYVDKSSGQEKTYWDRVGEMVEFDNGNRLIKIPAIGLEASVFEDKPRETQPAPAAAPTEEINPEDIPF